MATEKDNISPLDTPNETNKIQGLISHVFDILGYLGIDKEETVLKIRSGCMERP